MRLPKGPNALVVIFILTLGIMFMICIRNPFAVQIFEEKNTLAHGYTDHVLPNQSSLARLYEVTYNQSCEPVLSKKPILDKTYGRTFHMIAAAPGSGSDYCRLAIALATGINQDETSDTHQNFKRRITNIKYYTNPGHLYYKTHYPFFKSNKTRLNDLIPLAADKAVLLIRDPVQAGFSDYIRKTVKTRGGGKDSKYSGLENLLKVSDLVGIDDQPSQNLKQTLVDYIREWENHARYWLETYTGQLHVVLYRELSSNVSIFGDILSFFGYNISRTNETALRYHCFIAASRKREAVRKPTSKTMEISKMITETYFLNTSQQAVGRIESLLFNKTGVRYTIS